MASDGRVAVVTGASSGIGEALAVELSHRGYKLGLIARRADRVATLAERLRLSGASAEHVAADVGDRAAVLAAFAELREKLGPVDLMIANAGLGGETFWQPPNVPEQIELLKVNLLGVIHALEAVVPDMLERGVGHVAAVSSVAAYKGLPAAGAYCASKSGVNAYMESLRIQIRGRGVKVTTLCPGFVRTAMTSKNQGTMPFLLEPDVAARRMVRAIERGAKEYAFPWRMKALIQLTRWLPDWLIARQVREGEFGGGAAKGS